MSEVPTVSHVMMTDFKAIDGVTKISETLKIMKSEKVNVMLINPRDDSDVYGLMTLKDIARKVIAERRKLHETHAYEIMSKPVLSVASDLPVPYAARFLTNFNVSYAMVVKNEKVVGMVSLNGMVMQWEGS